MLFFHLATLRLKAQEPIFPAAPDPALIQHGKSAPTASAIGSADDADTPRTRRHPWSDRSPHPFRTVPCRLALQPAAAGEPNNSSPAQRTRARPVHRAD